MPSKVPSMILEFLKRNVSLGRYIGSVSPVDYEAKSFLQQSAGCWTIKNIQGFSASGGTAPRSLLSLSYPESQRVYCPKNCQLWRHAPLLD